MRFLRFDIPLTDFLRDLAAYFVGVVRRPTPRSAVREHRAFVEFWDAADLANLDA